MAASMRGRPDACTSDRKTRRAAAVRDERARPRFAPPGETASDTARALKVRRA